MKPVEVRQQLVDALRLDLIGPCPTRNPGTPDEILPQAPSPIPLEECPWCGTKSKSNSFQLVPNADHPSDLRVMCVNRRCKFSRGRPLPILAADEPIYRRLPCLMIATVDKFAAMPWTGEVGGFFRRVQRYDENGFYGPCEPTRGHALPGERLLPPDLIIQDELHLISGPLGTMVGLYETALDQLCSREVDRKKIRPKIVASTATVRRADNQIRALFNHRLVDIFPPPRPNRRDSFFAKTQPSCESHARLYVGIAALAIRQPPRNWFTALLISSRTASGLPTGRFPKSTTTPVLPSQSRGRRARLHAKCVVVHNRVVFVSSANFTEPAQERNIEIGLLVRPCALAEQVTSYFDTLLAAGLLTRIL